MTDDALKKDLASIPASGLKGDSTSAAGAGVLEANLLAAIAVRSLADRIRSRITDHLDWSIVVLTATEAAGLQQSSSLAFAKYVMTAAQTAAQTLSSPRQAPGPKLMLAAPGAVPLAVATPFVGPAIDALGKIASYFKVDYTVAGADLSVDEILFTAALTESLSVAGFNVYTPSLQPPSFERLGSRLLSLLSDLAAMKANAVQQSQAATTANNLQAADAWNLVSTLYDTFVGKLVAPDATGALPVARLAVELEVQKFASKGSVLVVKPHKVGGSFVTRKTIFSTFGICDPFSVAGGALLSYALFSGNDGRLLQSGVIPAMTDRLELRDVKGTLDDKMDAATRQIAHPIPHQIARAAHKVHRLASKVDPKLRPQLLEAVGAPPNWVEIHDKVDTIVRGWVAAATHVADPDQIDTSLKIASDLGIKGSQYQLMCDQCNTDIDTACQSTMQMSDDWKLQHEDQPLATFIVDATYLVTSSQ